MLSSFAAAVLVTLGLALVAPDAVAQAPSPAATRPRIGLVLAGGGAKGAAHIGVLRVLDELRIPIDCVAGTSMGALVGAVYSAGVPPADIESAVLAINWAETVGGQGRRDRAPIQRKLAGVSYTNSLEMGLNGGRMRMPSGLLVTQEIEQVIRTLVADARSTRDFDDLPIPFRAMATDMLSGELVILDGGDLATAMRASMAMPGVFAPVALDGRVLSDGGMMRNLPVDIARDMCADVVIAVWMSTPQSEAADLESALALLSRSMDVMIRANERAQIASLRPDDIAIEVAMGDIGSADFDRVPDAVELGRVAAAAQREALSRFSVPEEEYRAWARGLGRNNLGDQVLAEVRITSVGDRVNPEYIRSQLDVVPGTPVSIADIGVNIERVYALGDFDRVEYSLTGPLDQRVLEIAPVEKPWGPDFFRFDAGLASYEGGDLFAILRLDHDRTWINSRGGRWHNALQIGRQAFLTTDFYQPLDVSQRFFVQPIAMVREDIEDIYLDGDRVARYELAQMYGQVDVGINFGTRAQLRLGLRRSEHEATRDTGLPGLPELERTDDTNLQLRAVYDTRDSVALPTRGSFLNARYVRSADWFGGEQDYEIVEAVFAQSFDVFGGDSLSLMAAGANRLDGEVPITYQIKVGGIRTSRLAAR